MLFIIVGINILCIFGFLRYLLSKEIRIDVVLTSICIMTVLFALIIFIDYKSQTDDYEIRSGEITGVEHKEEWVERIPEKIETYTETDSNGKMVTKTRVIPAKYIHHEAENYVTTSDRGTFEVYETLDGKKFTDYFVNSDKELEKYYPIGKVTSSVHKYENKIKASYSIFKHKNIDLKDYKYLPEYPLKQNGDLNIDRLIGDFENKKELNNLLNRVNSRLNDTDNPNNTNNTKSYKQVNLMFVNMGNVDEDYGYALQDYWRNGAKNDFIVAFGTDKNNKPIWCNTFSWSDVEILKMEVSDYIMSKDNLGDFKSVINNVSKMVEDKFERKQFKDFDYIQVDTGTFANVLMVIILIGCCILILIYDL